MEFHNGRRHSSGAGVGGTHHLAARTGAAAAGQGLPVWPGACLGCELGRRLVRGPLTRSAAEGPHSPSGWRVTPGRTRSRSVRVSEFSDAAGQLLLSRSVPGGAEAGDRGGAAGALPLCAGGSVPAGGRAGAPS